MTTRTTNILYRIATGLLAFGMTAGGLGQIAGAKFNADGMIHLGYPLYLMRIIGVWKILGVVTLLIPGFLLAKEWAYAGFFFLLTGAVVSHIASGDPFLGFLAPLVFACLTVISWYTRPAERKLRITKQPV